MMFVLFQPESYLFCPSSDPFMSTRSPARSRGKDKSPLPSAGRRQPKKARSLSPRQRRLTPLSSAAAGGDGGHSPAKLRSPGRRGLDSAPSPLAKVDRRARSRTPVSTKRKLEEELRSPSSARAKDDTRSLVLKRLREESRSPGRKSSRHPSPAGSHHSLGSHSGMEPRRRPGSAHRDVEARFFGQVRDRDSPARRDRDRERERDAATKMEVGILQSELGLVRCSSLGILLAGFVILSSC